MGTGTFATATALGRLPESRLRYNLGMTREDAIADIARKLWERAGKPAGRDLEIWLEAEAHYDRIRTFWVMDDGPGNSPYGTP